MNNVGPPSGSLVLLQQHRCVAVVTLNHPEKRNVLSREVLTTLIERLESISTLDKIKCVVLAANGPAFSAGHDLNEIVKGTRADQEELFRLCARAMETIRLAPYPVIAQVQGIATAAGCQLAATCDLVVASEKASFATPGVKIGLFCSTPAVALSRAVHPKQAMEMLLTGMPISATEARKIGLVNRVVPADRLAAETLELAQRIADAASYTIGLGKRTFYEQLTLPRPEAYEVAQTAMVENALAPDAQEGMSAFLEKRAPMWKT